MSGAEAETDATGAYLASVLSLDPARDAAEILRLRREFLGRPSSALPVPSEEAEARIRVGMENRAKREMRARAAAIVEEERRPALRDALLSLHVPEASAPAEGKGRIWKVLMVLWVLGIVFRLIHKLGSAGN